MLVDAVSHACIVAHDLIDFCMQTLDGLLAVQTDRAMYACEARDVHSQHVQFGSDGLLREVLLEFGTECATRVCEGIDLRWPEESVSGVECVGAAASGAS